MDVMGITEDDCTLGTLIRSLLYLHWIMMHGLERYFAKKGSDVESDADERRTRGQELENSSDESDDTESLCI